MTSAPGRSTDGLSYDPAWSPNGQKIAYVSAPSARGDLNIYTMNAADGAGVARQTSYLNNTSSTSWSYPSLPVWSPDNTKIAYQLDKSSISADNTTKIYRTAVTADGSGAAVLLSSNTFSYELAWTLDKSVPVATVARPAAPDYSSYGSSLTSAAGTAADLGGSSLSEITGQLYRAANSATGTAAGYWTGGTGWATSSTDATTWRARDTGSTLASWTVALPALPDGVYAFRARAKDGAGNVFTSAWRYFKIANSTAPSARIAVTFNLLQRRS